ncbi:transglycosylase SLT domain-containing protein [Streptomyces sp. NPDC091259]|uniref:transglycosylase SLT domain-containing protein n=1 Tax=Streptomyces sp. NPDC091259 TaxID=3365976 RepID=UPI00380C0436
MANLDIVGSVAVDVVPVVPQFHEKLKALVLPIADKVGKEAGERMGRAISDNIVVAIPAAVQRGGAAAVRVAGRQGDDAGGAFARSMRQKLEIALKAMPKINIGADTSEVDSDLQALRVRLETLSGRRIGIDIEAAEAERQVADIEAELRRLGAAHPNITVRADTAVARAALADIREAIAEISARPGHVRLETDGAFGAKLRAVVEQARSSLPEINITADTSPARAEIQSLRAQLDTLADARVGIDVDAATALAEIARVQERLRILSLTTADVDVRADTAAAAAQLEALRVMADDTKVFRIKALADTSQATGALMGLAIQFGILLALPAVLPIAAGIGGIAAMATAGAAGVGALALVAIPAIKGVTEALTAKSAADKEAASAANAGAKTAGQAAQRALQMAGAQDALSAAHRNAARSIAQADRQVEDAQRAVAQASQRAADERVRAVEAVERAEEALVRAKRDAQHAEEDLTQARADAAQQLKELNDRLADGALDQRAAALRVRKAEEDLAGVRAKGAAASSLELDEAQLRYDQAVQSAKEQKQTYADLQKDAAKQRKAGVEGSDAVRAATERMGDAQRAVRDQTKAVADAQTAAARQQVESAQAVADAQRRVADAAENAANTRISAAESIESAERGVESARLSGLSALSQSATKTAEYEKALAKLTPAQRALFDSIAGPQGLTSAFKAWSKELQPQVLPLFTRGVDGAKSTLPGLTPLVLGAARAISTLMDKASAELKTPFWQGFKQDISANVEPAITGLGTAFGNIIKGMAGMIDAFLPHMDGIVAASDRITGRFAAWGSSLKGSPDFEKFLAYVKDTSPGLAEFLGKILSTLLDVAKALSPLSQTMFEVLGPVIEGIDWLVTNAPGFVQILWGIYFAQKALTLGMAAFGAAMAVYDIAIAGATLVTSGWAAAINATGIVPLIRAIVIVVGLLALAVIWAYNNVGWFKTAVDTAWAGIKIATEWLWGTVLKPIIGFIWWALKGLGDIAMWLWENAIGPAFSFIWGAAKMLFQIVATIVLVPLILVFKLLGAIAMWLWEEAIQPIFHWIGELAMWLYVVMIRPAFEKIKEVITAVGIVIKWLWREYVSPIFDWIADKAKWLYEYGVKPHLEKLRFYMDLVAAAFEQAKNNIKRSWDQLGGIAKGPVSFIVNTVYNEGIVPVWKQIAKITGADELHEIKGFHTGGIMSGYSPGQDDRLIAVGGGEAIMRPEWTRAVGAERINAWNAAARSGGIGGVRKAVANGMPAFKDGGIVGWLSDKASSVGSFLKGGWDALSDPGKLFDDLAAGLKSRMADTADNNAWSDMITKLPISAVKHLKDKVVELFASFGGDGGSGDGGSGVARWRGAVNQALTMTGNPLSYADVTLRRMSQESGGNPRAVNLWDINAKSGTPSVGLMQVIQPTFDAYAGFMRNVGPKMYGVSIDPIANLYSSMRYAMAAYGSLPRAYNQPGGYAAGGIPGIGETAWVGENGPELVRFLGPTQVYSHAESMALARQAASLKSVGPTSSTPNVLVESRVFVGDREITDIVRHEVTVHSDGMADQLITGRRV